MMTKARMAAMLPVLLALGACETSARLGSMMPGSGAEPISRRASRTAPAPLTPAPVGEVYTSDLNGGGASSSSLPPPVQTPAPAAPRTSGLSSPGNFPAGTSGSPIDPAPGGAGSTTYFPSGAAPSAPAAPAPQVAAAPRAPAAPSRNSVVGNWSVREQQGSTCRITLSSSPKLDLYGAGTAGCQSKEMQRVNAWELAGSEVLLYEPGGGVVARLRQAGNGYSGATARTGAPVSLSK